MAIQFFARQTIEPRDIGRPAWAEVSGIVLVLVAVVVGMAIMGTFSPF
jgi:hypothetical protein